MIIVHGKHAQTNRTFIFLYLEIPNVINSRLGYKQAGLFTETSLFFPAFMCKRSWFDLNWFRYPIMTVFDRGVQAAGGEGTCACWPLDDDDLQI
jgi:hypothetical protein